MNRPENVWRLLLCLVAAGCVPHAVPAGTAARKPAAEQAAPEEWRQTDADAGHSRSLPLTLRTPLQVAWRRPLPPLEAGYAKLLATRDTLLLHGILGRVLAFDSRDGKLLWDHDPWPGQGAGMIPGNTAATENRVIQIAPANAPHSVAPPASRGPRLVGRTPATGEEIFSLRPLGLGSPAEAVLMEDGISALRASPTRLLTLRPDTGAITREEFLNGVEEPPLYLAEFAGPPRRIVVQTLHWLYLLDPASLTPVAKRYLWYPSGRVVSHGEQMYFVGGLKSGGLGAPETPVGLHALDAQCKLLWSDQGAFDESAVLARLYPQNYRPAFTRNNVLISAGQAVYASDAATGRRAWTHKSAASGILIGASNAALAATGDRPEHLDTLTVLDEKRGQPIWKSNLGLSIQNMILHRGSVYVYARGSRKGVDTDFLIKLAPRDVE